MAESETKCTAAGLNTLEPECVTANSRVSDLHHTEASLIKTETDLSFTNAGDLKTESLDFTDLAHLTHLYPGQVKTETDDGESIKFEHISVSPDIKCVYMKSDDADLESGEILDPGMNLQKRKSKDEKECEAPVPSPDERGRKKPKSPAEKQKECRERLKVDPVKYAEVKEVEWMQSKLWRLKRSEQKIQRERKFGRERSARFQECQKAEGKMRPLPPKRTETSAQAETWKLHKQRDRQLGREQSASFQERQKAEGEMSPALQKRREMWKFQKHKQRSRMSKQKRRQINQRRRELYAVEKSMQRLLQQQIKEKDPVMNLRERKSKDEKECEAPVLPPNRRGHKKPKSPAEKQKEYRERLKADPAKYAEVKEVDRTRSKLWRLKRSEQQIQRDRQLGRERSARFGFQFGRRKDETSVTKREGEVGSS
ncbi:hypothetical protein GJAV_G00087880 [Gymnothorax javanicus]|nr:hypothetical protein GJAV_G00087880 [Gymnothorax javanicus]